MKHAPYWPRMLTRAKAAAYVDLPATKFMQEVAAGRLPMPVRIGGQEHWDRNALDLELDRLSGSFTDWRKDQPGLAA